MTQVITAVDGVRERDQSLDWLKGALVAVMVCHHGIEYFDRIDAPSLKYLDFVTGAFPFVALFISGQALRHRGLARSWSKRTSWRALKLIGVFTVVNLIVGMLTWQTRRAIGPGEGQLLSRIMGVYGWGDRGAVSFEILLPIAYAQLMAAGLVLVRYGRAMLVAGVAAGISICLWSSDLSFNIYYTTIGLVACEVGRSIDIASLRSCYERGGGRRLAGAAAACFLVATTLVEHDNIVIYLASVIAMCILLDMLAVYVTRRPAQHRLLPVFGRYSLFCYMAHVVVFRALVTWPTGISHGTTNGLVAAAIMCVGLLGAVCALEAGRKRLRLLDDTYRVIFA